MTITQAFNNVNLDTFNSDINTRIQDLISNTEILKSTFQNVNEIINEGLDSITSEHILNLKEGETDVGQFIKKKNQVTNDKEIEFIYQSVLLGKYSFSLNNVETIDLTKHSERYVRQQNFFSVKEPNKYYESKSKDIDIDDNETYTIKINNKSFEINDIEKSNKQQLREQLIKRFITKSDSSLDSPYTISRYEDTNGEIYLRLTFNENGSQTKRKFQRIGDLGSEFTLIQSGDAENPSIQDFLLTDIMIDVFYGLRTNVEFQITLNGTTELQINLFRGIEEVEQTSIDGNLYQKTKKLSRDTYNSNIPDYENVSQNAQYLNKFMEEDVHTIVNEKENLNFGFIFNITNDEQLQQMIREWLAIIIYEAKDIQLNIEVDDSKILIIDSAKDENGNVIKYSNVGSSDENSDFDDDGQIDWYKIQDTNSNLFDFYLRPTLFFNIKFDNIYENPIMGPPSHTRTQSMSLIHPDIQKFINKLMTYDYSNKEYYFANRIIGNLHLENINNYNNAEEKLQFEENLNKYMEDNKCLLNYLTKQSYEFSYVTHYKTFDNGETTQTINYSDVKTDTRQFLINENILLESMAGICGDPHILTFGGNRLELPHIENKFNLLTYGDLIINTETYFVGNEVFLKNIKIYYNNDDLLINLSNLELDKDLNNFKVNSKSINSIEICTYDNLFKFIFNSEINGFIVKSYEELTQSNSTGILMSNYFENCTINKL